MKKVFLLFFLLVIAAVGALFPEALSADNSSDSRLKFADQPLRPESFNTHPLGDDWSDAIERAAEFAHNQGGNTIKFGCGITYTIKRKLNLDGAQRVSMEGCANDYEQQAGKPTISYTGADESAFSFRSSYGIRLRRLKLEYNNPGFEGILVDTRHSVHNPSADSMYFTIEDCTFTGTAQANKAAALLAIDGSIISRIKTTHFFHASVGIRGMKPETGNYSNVITVTENSFNNVDFGILNPSSNWSITTNAFEPNNEGKVRAVDYDCSNCQTASGVTYHNNYHGDAVSQTEPIVRFHKAAGLSIFGNWWIIEGEKRSRAAITLDNCEGVKIFGNRANGIENFVESIGGTSFDVGIEDNQTTAPVIALQTAQIVGLRVFQASTHGNLISGLASNGEASVSHTDFGTSIGRISALGAENSFARIGILDGATGYLNRSLGYFAPSNNQNPHIFFTWDGAKWQPRFEIGAVNRSFVPVTVPREAFSDRWKDSSEVPTKADIYAALKQLIADRSEQK